MVIGYLLKLTGVVNGLDMECEIKKKMVWVEVPLNEINKPMERCLGAGCSRAPYTLVGLL